MGLPDGWRLTTVGEAGRLQLGRQRAPRYHSGTNMKPYLRVANVFEDHIDLADLKSMHFDPEEFERYRLHDGDVLLNEGQTPELLGRPAIYRELHGELAFTNSLIRFQAGEGVDPRWALAVFRHHMHSGRFKRESRITTNVAHLSLGRLRDVEFPLPPLGEQRRIVAILEDHFSRLDAADLAVTDAVRRVQGFRAAVLQEAFRGSAAPVRPLLEVATIANGQTPKGLVENLTAHRGDGAVPFFKVGDMNAADGRWMDEARFFTSKQVAARLGLRVRPPGTVLIPKRGGAIATNKKRVLREPACYDLNTMGLIPGAELESAYLWHWLQTVDLGRIADGSNVPQINAAQVREMSLPVPTKEVQRSICDHLDAIGDQVARLEVEIAAARQRAGTLRAALLAGAFSGKLTVKEHVRV